MIKKSLNINEGLGNIKEKIVNFVIPAICLVASILIGVLVLYPSYKSLPTLKTELDSKTKLNNTLDTKLKNLKKMVDFKKVVEENSRLINTVLVSDELVPALLTQVDKIVTESGLTISRLNYSLGGSASPESAKSTSYKTVVVNFGGEGYYNQVETFLKNLENSARLIDVQSVRYSMDERDEAVPLSVSFVLHSPYLFVESTAVMDDPVDLDISDPNFLKLINRIKGMRYYDPYNINSDVPVVLAPEDDVNESSGSARTTDSIFGN